MSVLTRVYPNTELPKIISYFYRAFLNSITFYWPTHALNIIKWQVKFNPVA